MQPAAEAAYAAFDDDAMTAYMAPEAIPAASLSDVAYAETAAPQQPGYYELPAQDFASLDDFLAQNTARGILELQVRIASDDAAPVPGAVVDILKTINGVTYLFHHGVTDAGGSAGRIALPAPDRSLSFAPPNGFVPYAVYTVSVTHGDYAPQVLENVAVFPATQSLQVVRLGMAATPSVIDEGLYAM
ncbi:MAG: carboxypeptidase-like regulatory domain-containing protein [Firmicutes bacterium]|nr:carboxypeptidase-like regulatory domain-containing protein [Bacillota bacterium]